jgi:RNA polymerase sigma factor (sigma-70 family)
MTPLPSDLSTGFVGRLRARDPQAWFELWETFGPVLRNQLRRWGRGRIGIETVQDLSQETLAALAGAIDQHDPSRGARFSTWLLAIAKYTFGDEMDRRMAKKRGEGRKPLSIEEAWAGASALPSPDESYEQAVFGAKIEAAIRLTERESEFVEFTIYRMRILEGRTGKEVARSLRVSEPTVSRRLAAVRKRLRAHLTEVIAKYSFTEEELTEGLRNALGTNPTKADDALFDEAIAEIWRRLVDQRAEAEAREQGMAQEGDPTR